MYPSAYRLLSPAVLWLALTPCNAPAQGEPPPAAAATPVPAPAPVPAKPPRFHSSGNELLPDTVLEVEFPQSVIPADKVNTEHDLITTDPPIPGKGTWTSRTTARFTFTAAPPQGTSVKFSIVPGRRYEDGTPIPSGVIGSRATPAFGVLSWPWLELNEREPVNLIIFSENVDLATAAPFILYGDGGSGRLPAKTGPVFFRDLPAHLQEKLTTGDGVPWTARWKPRAAGTAPVSYKPEDTVPNAIVIRPHGPLPVGEHWHMEVMAGLPSASCTVRTAAAAQGGNFRVAPLEAGQLWFSPAGSSRVALHLPFTRPLPKEAVDWKQWVSVFPDVKDLKITAKDAVLTLESPDLTYRNNWTVKVKAGMASADGRTTQKETSASINPEPAAPDLSLPSWDTAQLAAGTRKYRIHSRNLEILRVRVKSLSPEDGLRTLRAFASVKPAGEDSRSGKVKASDLTMKGSLPWSIVPGRTVLDKEWTFENSLDKSCPVTLDWTQLLGGGDKPGILFVSAEGDILPEAVKNRETPGQRLAQAVVQITDIGLTWKLNATEALLYAFSLKTGQPLGGTKFTLYDSEGSETATLTADGDGICRVPRTDSAVLLTARYRDDQFTVAFDRTIPREDLWRFPVQVDWSPSRGFQRQAMMFTDRGLYRPGETVHMKGIVRRRMDADLRLPEDRQAQFTVLDADRRSIVDKKVELSEAGTFSESFILPPEKVGRFTMRLELSTRPKTGPEESEDDGEREGEFDGEYAGRHRAEDTTFSESFQVEEFRRNTFEISMVAPECPPGTRETTVNLSASYLMGQHLSDAKVRYYVHAEATGFYPDGYQDYLFGDHQGYDPDYWRYYYGWEGRWGDDDTVVRGSDHQTGERMLGSEGKLPLPVVLPQPEFPSSHRVQVSAEVTDVNQQTLSESTVFTVHPAALHLGMARNDSLLRTGQPLGIKLVALTADAKPVTRDLPVQVKVTHEVWETVQTVTASGFTQNRSDMHMETVREENVVIPAGGGTRALPFAWSFTPEKSGAYIVEFRAADEAGRITATRTRYYCYGAGEYAWEYSQGDQIRLVPEKKSWKPGQTARVLVMTPIEGTALVTLERANVVRAFTTRLTLDKPVLEIPLTDNDAPNVYVSVSVLKGLADSRREIKEPVLKLGYCQLMVENTADDLSVEVNSTRPYFRPGTSGEISGVVKNRDGQPVPDAEVTLWAVDEGVLSVMGYQNPDPRAAFMPLLPLSVRCGTSLELYLPEDAAQRWYVNKGFLIGDGEGESSTNGKLRKDFNPLAFWQADLRTGADGRYRAQFPLPDTLTRYRVIALAVQGARGFGVGTGALTVNKPLMLEPVVPRFASVGDVLVPKAVLHNTSKWGGTFMVSLACGDEVKGNGTAVQKVELAAGETRSLTWNVEFTRYGDANWHWRAEPDTLPADCPAEERAELVDFVESRFPVKYPGPLLTEQRSVVFSADNREADLLAGFSPGLKNRATRVEVDLSRSRFQEAAEAMSYLLTYPYGCVEQTSSSTMPWLAVHELKGLVPKLNRSTAETQKMIQAGANRLLSMRTDSGGLAYWPGAAEPNLWGSCWGGFTLLRCRDHGAEVPQEAVDGLTKWLSGELRRLFADLTPANAQHAAAALCTLAWAGKSEQAWHSRLYEQRAVLSRGARIWLALAIGKSGGPKEQALELLNMPVAGNEAEPYVWFSHGDYAAALQLFAWCEIAPKDPLVEAALVALTGMRGREGHWHTTFNNAWALTALAAYASRVEAVPGDVSLTLSGLDSRQFQFTAEQPAQFLSIKPAAGLAAALPAVLGGANARLYASVKLTGQPELLPMREVSSGLAITRTYQRLAVDGKQGPLGEPSVGDLVLVTLRLHVPENVHYVAVDDPLPATFEAVNSEFASQAAAGAGANAQAQADWREWTSSHKELRDDRALFFCDYVYGSRYEIRYLARVTGVGEATAAQARIEAMYAPAKYGLSDSLRIKTLPRKDAGTTVAGTR